MYREKKQTNSAACSLLPSCYFTQSPVPTDILIIANNGNILTPVRCVLIQPYTTTPLPNSTISISSLQWLKYIRNHHLHP